MSGHILYSFRRCPYAMRARMALYLAGTEYEHREVSLRDKPEAMLEASPKGSVPVFMTSNEEVIDQSLDILRWAIPDAALKMEFVAQIDGPFKHHLDRYKYASRYDETAKRGDVDLGHRAEAVEILQPFERTLEIQTFLSGADMGPTDIATFPFIRQFAAVEPDWWSNESGLPKMRDWLKNCITSDLFKAIMEKYPLWSPPE
ncbi:glutathione S-transferase N-terminal domain-containing protein [Litorimonas sp. WD9-15]|uniref:glutathione S-transferase N-terminal domain-containing protein n=1 Tax=Litorimonas sp. WD9-15 TaxID=3418716 RepID=UPI003D046DDE